MQKRKRKPRCIVIAGPNGAGKTTFARRYLPEDAGMVHFVNADLIAGGLSPLKPQLAAMAAARMVLREIDRLAAERSDFAFESTLSGLSYAPRPRAWRRSGYLVEIVYLRLRSTRLALRRIAARVRQGGHDVPRRDVVRRFSRSWENFERLYKPLADSWLCTTILAVHPGSWRGVHEGEDANQGKSITELCCRRRTRLASRGKGCAQDRAHVWHAALRLGGREGSGEEAVRPCCARNARTSDWVCRDCAVMSLGRGLASAASG